MKRIVRTGVFVAATAAVVISGTLVSYANWIAPASTATARIRAASMPPGVTPSATIQSGQAVVSWSAQEIVPGVRMTTYVVTAHDTGATPLLPIAHTVTASGSTTESATFTAAELAGGKWKWAIVPKFRTWIGAEGRLSNPKLVFPAAGPATVLAQAMTAVAAAGTVPPTAPGTAPTSGPPAEPPTGPTTGPVAPTPASIETKTPTPPSPTTEAPKADPTKTDPTTAAPEKTARPETTAEPATTAGPATTAEP